MTDVVIRAENLSKRYRLGQRENYVVLRDHLARWMAKPFRALRKWREKPENGRVNSVDGGTGLRMESGRREWLWALKDVSFEVEEGEVVGIIGRNGAGKSTLLKLLSQITEPTEGLVRIRGRVGSLLEVGTGFHPELTGRENIYLNGAILGMRRAEIERKYDEIASFSEVEKFLNTPVKFYSTGMYVRLAFAVAAHLDPEILLIDEVLAVGDSAFQKKCLGRMSDVAKGGRTILYVSHQLSSVRKLCQRSIWLDSGKVRMIDSTEKVLSAYEHSLSDRKVSQRGKARDPNIVAQFLDWEILEPRSEEPHVLNSLGPVKFRIGLDVNKPFRAGIHGIVLRNSEHQIIWSWTQYNVHLDPGVHDLVYTLPGLPLQPGMYSWDVSLFHDGKVLDMCQCVPDLIMTAERLSFCRDERVGLLNVPCEFRVQTAEIAER